MSLFNTAETMSPMEAFEILGRFAASRGELALRLAMHAAVPETLRPDLLHLMKRNFVLRASDNLAVEADVLFSPMMEDLGDGYFQYDAEVRRQLLDNLAVTYQHEPRIRVQRVAELLLAYIRRNERDIHHDRIFQDFLEIQRWVALSFLHPQEAAHQLAVALKYVEEQAETSIAFSARVQLGGVAAAISIPLAHERELLTYAVGLGALETGDLQRAQRLLRAIGDQPVSFGDIILKPPTEVLDDRGRSIRPQRDLAVEDPDEEAVSFEELPTMDAKLEDSGFIQAAREYVLAHIRDIRVDDLADRLGMAPKILNSRLQETTGLSSSDFIQRVRLELAASLLKEKDSRVGKIAREVGYQDVEHFSRLFKKAYGVNPGAYARGLREDLESSDYPATYTNHIGMEFVLIQPGSFMMGSENGKENEKPVHRVEITRPFYIGIHQVTQGQWESVMGKNPSYFKKGASYPVGNVSWNDVQQFIEKINETEEGHRLPTEAEWEYACRAGTHTEYFFGDDANELSRYAVYDQSGKGPEPVGSKEPNPWRLYDTLGNVWEWVQDWWDASYYERSPERDPQGPEKGNLRVLRGGSYASDPNRCRCAARLRHDPGSNYRNLGFRVVVLP